MPAYDGYTTYDEVYMWADAIKRAGSTDPDKIVDAMEKTDYVGTIGHIQFLRKDDQLHARHEDRAGLHHRRLMVQWQNGKPVTRLADRRRQRAR